MAVLCSRVQVWLCVGCMQHAFDARCCSAALLVAVCPAAPQRGDLADVLGRQVDRCAG